MIVGLGEALFDLFPDGAILGGAPLNVAVQAQQAAAVLAGRAVPVSRIGRDELGERLLAELAARGVETRFLQQDERHPTGRVLVTLEAGEPQYEIVRDVAWDHLAWTDELRQLAETCGAVCFGTLAQRSPAARETILRFLDHAPQAVRLFDVNLRQEFFTPEILRQSCQRATMVKLNQHELPHVCRLLGLEGESATADDQAAALRRAFDLTAVVLTRGAAGTALYDHNGRTVGEPVRYPRHARADSVGAGDACSAGLLVGRLLDWPAARVVALADHMGAFVASQPGATPTLPASILDRVRAE